LTVYMLLPHPPGDELVVLRAEIDNQNHPCTVVMNSGITKYVSYINRFLLQGDGGTMYCLQHPIDRNW
jgi:hypothetical protein